MIRDDTYSHFSVARVERTSRDIAFIGPLTLKESDLLFVSLVVQLFNGSSWSPRGLAAKN